MTRKNGGSGPRAVALVGPYGSGKTTLLESILSVTGAVQRKGAVAQGNTIGDSSAEARARQMSVEVNCATTKFLDESFTFIDCPGSIEFLQETLNVLPGIVMAVFILFYVSRAEDPEPPAVRTAVICAPSRSIPVTRAMITRTFFCLRMMARIGQATSAGDSAAVAT